MQPMLPSSGVSFETSQLSGSGLAMESIGSPSSQYDPDIYKCKDLDEEYLYFDGKPGSDHDQRFTIDLEHGTMDR